MKIRIIVVAVVVILGAGAFWHFSKDSRQETRPLSVPGRLDEDGGPAVHPVSLQAFAKREFDGRDLRLGRVLDQSADFTRYAIIYKSGELTISGVMQVPKKGSGPFPVVITNHGFIDPSVYTIGRGLRREHDFLTRNGYVVLHPDYRNHAESDKDPDTELGFRLGYAEDSANAVLAVQESNLPFLDGSRIGMLGHSMGGGVTLNILAALPELVRAAVLYAPVSADARDNFDRWTRTRPQTAQQIIDSYGSPENNPEFWDNLSPITFVEQITAPVIIHHGTADESVPLEWSRELAAALEERGKDATLYMYEDEVHEFVREWQLFMGRTVEFFDKYLKT